MSKSLIRKNQLHPDINDLVGQYGSGYFSSNNSTVLITGNQTISGVKTFATGIFAPNLVYNTGNQTISGVKTFATGITVSGTFVFASPFVPTATTNTGLKGQLAYTDNYLYICISNNTWRRVQLGTW